MSFSPFLYDVAQQISKQQTDLSQTLLVLPNRRAGLYLKEHLKSILQPPFWLPEIVTISDWVLGIEGRKEADGLTSLFNLFKAYQAELGNKAQSFEQFMGWGNSLLSDFEELTKEATDPKEIFEYLTDAKAIERWSPDGESLTSSQQSYLVFWNKLYPIYIGWKENVSADSLSTYGIALNDLVSKKEETLETAKAYSAIHFVGFSALTRKEQELFKQLEKAPNVNVYWDIDSYYFNDKLNEAGQILRSLNYKLNSIPAPQSSFKNSSAVYREFACANGQIAAYKAGQLVEEANGKTAIVLADESSAEAMLNALPDSAEKFNLAIGFSLSESQLANWVGSILRMWAESNDSGFYFESFFAVCQSKYVELLGISKSRVDQFISQQKKENTIRISSNSAADLSQADLFETSFLFEQPSTPETALKQLSGIVERLLILDPKAGKSATHLEHEIAAMLAMKRCINGLLNREDLLAEIDSMRGLTTILDSIIKSQKARLAGEPISGLQILGLLETRAVDFEHVIIVGMNEGTLPSSGNSSSFIPMDIRREFGLPTIGHSEGVAAYHFYRLLQRAKKVDLLYSTDNSGLQGGEPSRFLLQLKQELPVYSSGITYEQHQVLVKPGGELPLKYGQPKNTESHQRLIDKLAKGISPSKLIHYLKNPVEFYYTYNIGIREEDEINAEVQHDRLGNYVHNTLEELYKPHIKTPLQTSDIEAMLGKWQPILTAQFLNEFTEDSLYFGNNRIVFEVAKKFVEDFLKFDLAFVQDLATKGQVCTILELEKKLEREIVVDGHPIKMMGFADRIDQVGNTVRIVDYKTGMVSQADLNVSKIEQFEVSYKKHKLAQLLCYAWMAEAKLETTQFQVANFSFRNFSGGYLYAKLEKETMLSAETLELFESELVRLFSEIMDIEKPYFSEGQNVEYCEFV